VHPSSHGNAKGLNAGSTLFSFAVDAYFMMIAAAMLLLLQMLGRGLRISPGKENCVVIDFTDTVHNPNRLWDARMVRQGSALRQTQVFILKR
jgi:superfamily II DNA or RNA helicase